MQNNFNKNQEEFKQKCEFHFTSEDFTTYTTIFVQRIPVYGIKFPGKTWKTKNKPLSDIPIKYHLEQRYYVGVIGKWYPGYCIFDIDDRDISFVDKIRDKLGLDTDNSMLFSSESPNSYHLLFAPSYKDKPVTLRFLNEVLKPFADEFGFEVYPQPKKFVRLPFGRGQRALDFEYVQLEDWREYLYWFRKLDNFDLSVVPKQQLRLFDGYFDIKSEKISTFEEGAYLYQNGLIEPNSRHKSQFKVLYYFWRKNVNLEDAINLTYSWIKKKHNNLSKEVNAGKWQIIRKEIERQAKHIYEKYEYSRIYPDSTHNEHNGYLTKTDIEKILFITKANLPKTKFLFNLVKFCYPRRFRTFIQIHSDKLISWCSNKKYLPYLAEFKGIIERFDSYKVKSFSKSIKINWDFRDPAKAILEDERAPDTLEDTVRIAYNPEEFRELLIKAKMERTTAIKLLNKIWGVKKS